MGLNVATPSGIHKYLIWLSLWMICFLLAACSSISYQPEKFKPALFSNQAQTQQSGEVRVTAAVPGRDQARQIFGFDMYERGIQPVWLSIENQTGNRIRYAPTGTDPGYFPPMEVAYMFRKSFSKQEHPSVEKHLYEHSMQRHIEAGSSVSGFIFTHVAKGRKNLVVDVFDTADDSHSFAFFLEVPGFIPDHAVVDFDNLYPPSEIVNFDENGFRSMLADWQCCTEDLNGNPVGLPLGVVMIGDSEIVLRGLMRAGWYETQWEDTRAKMKPESFHYLFGRHADAVMRIKRSASKERNELNIWKTPWLLNGEEVWVALITHFIGQRTRLEEALMGARFDPEIDDGRNFILQNVWYSQVLDQLAWFDGGDPSSSQQPRQDFNGAHYYTDGFRVVLWLSDGTVSLFETKSAAWDDPAGRYQQ
jgi:hypothetical protein